MGTLLVVVAALLVEAKPADLSRAVAADARVEVQNHSGSITVVGWDKPEVAVKDGEGVNFEGSEHWIKISVPHLRHEGESELEIFVPAGAQLEIHGHSTDVKVSGVRASVSVGVVSGNITVTGAQAVDLSTVSGDVHLDAPCKKTHAESVSGDVTVKGVTGAVHASTVNGSLDVQGRAIDEAQLETVSGDLKFLGDLGPQGRLTTETVSGDIELSFPSSTEADFETATFSGDITNDIGPKATTTSRYTSSKKLSFTTGKGGAKVSAKTMSGSIEIKGH
jgi:hypothetical protein